MATKLASYSRNVMFIPPVRLLVKNCRTFSSAPDILDVHNQDPADESTKTQTVWPDHLLGPLGPQDKRFPMPGRIGPCVNTRKLNQTIKLSQVAPPVADPDSVLPKLPFQRHTDVVEQFLASLDEIDVEFIDRGITFPMATDLTDYKAYSCPQLLRKEFKDLFLDRNIMEGSLTVVTICLNGKNDATARSSNFERERLDLLEMFIQAAAGICQAFDDDGHWADFIDPMSGKPFKGPHSNLTLYETDDRYRKLGFAINDLGYCKMINHPVWGSHAYVGSLFTSAPVNHPLIMNLTD